ncbi:MAG TPA: hypothetical protein VGP63_15240 [Planctomycetaceae bacterium]|nr:hypothetical protein [Planctomycetaceae bacterium]
MFARSSLPGSRTSSPVGRRLLSGLAFTLTVTLCLPAQAGVEHAIQITINTPMAPPAWAVLERELLRANAVACREFFQNYFDERGYLKCVERWGGDDGPDDAIENLSDWPILHALGASDSVLEMYKRGWEGHLRQYTQAKTKQVPFARQGMYYKEFPVMFDWLHNGEGLTPFDLQGLADPNDAKFQARVRRFAGFYVGDDPEAPNYDATHKIIRSLFNGSRGPLLRKATAVDWAGDPIEVGGRFKPLHGEHSYSQMLAHFEKYNDIVGDHPLNLEATSLAFNAYALAHDPKYKNWLVEYVDAWVDRARQNHDIIPSNVGLDGVIGSGAGHRWYGGVYGWGFTVRNPATGQMSNRNQTQLAITGFGNALLLTGNRKYVDTWRKLIAAVNANGRRIDGQMMYPTMYGDDGWYAFYPKKYSQGALNVWYWSMDPADRERVGENGWLSFLDGKDPEFADRTLAQEFLTIRSHIGGLRADRTTPQTRLADDPLAYNPATVYAMVNLMLGGLYPGHVGAPLHCRVRYFDPEKRRAGVPDDVAALVDRLTDTQTGITLINLNPVAVHSVVVQGGAYAEHQFADVTVEGHKQMVDAPSFTVELAPGSGARLLLTTRRYANPPSLKFPWDQSPPANVIAVSHTK